MSRMLRALCAAAFVFFGTGTLTAFAAQAAGKPATAKKVQPAPQPRRLADGKPNWTGFWSSAGGLLDEYRGPSFLEQPAGGGAGGGPPGASAGAALLKSPYKEQYSEYVRKSAAGLASDPVALCYPPGMPRMMVAVYGIEILQNPGQIAITSEWQSASRRIWMNAKAHPDAEELDPTYAGHSIGRWQGDMLVIDTVGIRADVPVDYVGLPQSGNMHVVERIAEKSPGILVNTITIEDPLAFSAPWTETYTYRYRPDLHLEEYTCLENNRNVGANGEQAFKN